MAESTISWTRYTFNPWLGCAEVSPACAGCYARVMVQDRFHRAVWGGPGKGVGTRARTSADYWRQPRRWNFDAELSYLAWKAVPEGPPPQRPFVFCASLADVFDNQVPVDWRADLFRLIRETPWLIWLLLTKRPQNIPYMVEQAGGLPRNVALGTTVEDMPRAVLNLPTLCTDARSLNPAFIFASLEPLLEEVNLRRIPVKKVAPHGVGYDHLEFDALTGTWAPGKPPRGKGYVPSPRLPRRAWGLDLCITGGETDQGQHKARPTLPDAFRRVRDDCLAVGTTYHHKQNGEWVSVSEVEGKGEIFTFPDGANVRRVGKAKSGRTLDGVIYDALPELDPVP